VRFLLAWEFGDPGRGREQCALARGLRDRGHTVLLAFADLAALGAESLEGIEWVQAPRLALPDSPNTAPIDPTDLLLNLGFGDAPALAGVLTGWSALARTWRPDALVADNAPTAMLAARLAGIPRVLVGKYALTAPSNPDPERDARLVDAVRRACERQRDKARTPTAARDLFEADARVPFGAPDTVERIEAAMGH
jgi:hypothetical protein